MADTKITALTAIGANPINVATFPIPMVDLLDNSMAASGTTKKVTVNQILGAGGTATLASATITGDLTVATSALKVTGGKVGIGTASPAYELDVSSATASNQLRIFGSNQNSITFANASGGASNGFLMGRSFSSDDANNLFVFDLANSALRLFIGGTGNVGIGTAAPTEAVDLNSGNLKLTNGNVVLGTSGKGIDFSATASGSGTMTSELLNDYEEGTWTATLNGSVSDPTTPVTATARYTKVGRQVTVQVYISNVVTTGASGRIVISGLPFANNGSIETIGAVGLYDIATFTGSPFAQIGFNATTVDLYSSVSNSTWQSVTHNAGTARYIWFNMTYTVA